jgi:hypothetical protein
MGQQTRLRTTVLSRYYRGRYSLVVRLGLASHLDRFRPIATPNWSAGTSGQGPGERADYQLKRFFSPSRAVV